MIVGKQNKHGETSVTLDRREAYLETFIAFVLLGFGFYHSVLYFGHQVVPNPDFTGFVAVGRRLLSFQLPTIYKRAPVLGILQVLLSNFVGGQHPDLTAGRLLNAIIHPFNVVLLYMVGKRVVGRAAVWVAIIAILNPWVIQLLTEPIAETTLLFFVLLTTYFIFRRSRWSYLFASITTMVRYEGAALILAAFVMDLANQKDRKQRLWAFAWSVVASIPLALWMLGTIVHWKGQGGTFYLKDLGLPGTISGFLVKYVQLIWRMAVYPLFMPTPGIPKGITGILYKASQVVTAVSFVFGVAYGLYKRRWNTLVLLIFLVPYVFVHAAYKVAIPRYCMLIHWIVLLICVYGLQSGWGLIASRAGIPKPLTIFLQCVVLIICCIWAAGLVPYLSKVAPMSRRSVSMPYVGMAAVGLIFVGRRFVYRLRYCWSEIVILVAVCLMIISNQFALAQVVRNGRRDIEFKLLADWYISNTRPGEKLVSTMSNILNIFAPAQKDYFVHMGAMKADNPRDFVKECYDKDITYVTWDSRIGAGVGGLYYRLWNIKNIAMLAKRENFGPYEFVTQIRVNERRFINVFRLRKM